jgi:hypothetical protein
MSYLDTQQSKIFKTAANEKYTSYDELLGLIQRLAGKTHSTIILQNALLDIGSNDLKIPTDKLLKLLLVVKQGNSRLVSDVLVLKLPQTDWSKFRNGDWVKEHATVAKVVMAFTSITDIKVSELKINSSDGGEQEGELVLEANVEKVIKGALADLKADDPDLADDKHVQREVINDALREVFRGAEEDVQNTLFKWAKNSEKAPMSDFEASFYDYSLKDEKIASVTYNITVFYEHSSDWVSDAKDHLEKNLVMKDYA